MNIKIIKSKINKFKQYLLLMRLHKPIGIFLLLWPTLWGLWIAAEGFPDQKILLVFILGVFLMRSAGCILNDIIDKDLDKFVTRTKDRPLASNKLSSIEAFTIACILICVAFLLILTTNILTIQLSFIAIILASIYPFLKRYKYIPQFFLGVTFGWSIPMQLLPSVFLEGIIVAILSAILASIYPSIKISRNNIRKALMGE